MAAWLRLSFSTRPNVFAHYLLSDAPAQHNPHTSRSGAWIVRDQRTCARRGYARSCQRGDVFVHGALG